MTCSNHHQGALKNNPGNIVPIVSGNPHSTTTTGERNNNLDTCQALCPEPGASPERLRKNQGKEESEQDSHYTSFVLEANVYCVTVTYLPQFFSIKKTWERKALWSFCFSALGGTTLTMSRTELSSSKSVFPLGSGALYCGSA